MQQSFAAWHFLKTTAAELTSIKVDLCGVRSSTLHTSIFQDGPSHAAIGSLARLAAHRLIVFVLPQIPSLIVQLRAPSTQVNQITPTGHQPIFEKTVRRLMLHRDMRFIRPETYSMFVQSRLHDYTLRHG
jgi:hypothetical protein